MARELSIGDVLHPRAEPSTMLRRGLAKHCPRCGGGHLFRGWFRMLERCPTCGYRFEREEGFFFGAYIVNLVVTEAVLFTVFLAYIGVHGAQGNDLRVSLVAACASALVVPVLFYPFSRTLWAAIDLIATPLELDEIIAAADSVGAGDATNPADDTPGDGPGATSQKLPPRSPALAWHHRGPHRAHRRGRRADRGRGGDGPGPGHR